MQRKLLSTSLVVTAMALTLSASAKNRGFSSDITGSITTPVKIEVTLSEDLAFRADNLPEKLKDRGSGFRRLNSGFALRSKGPRSPHRALTEKGRNPFYKKRY